MELNELQNRIIKIKEKGYRKGLTKEDYINLKKIEESINQNLVTIDAKWYDVFMEVHNLLEMIKESRILTTFTAANINYINKNAFLLPLVLANNQGEIKIRGNSNYMFSCQFHQERDPSMKVNDLKNYLQCFGCRVNMTAISYLQNFENISFKESVKLLSEIYLFDTPTKSPNTYLQDLAGLYQKVVLGKHYRILLEEGYEKIRKLNQSEQESLMINKEYEKRINTIERIRRGEYDSAFKYEEPPKVMYLRK